ncbi:MAG: hypothetical protein U9N59_13490 [Campylobacterota bacterium]|nr:hypothetical protein [Campylobacterota bacterium]
MTIKKLSLSAVAAATILSVSAFGLEVSTETDGALLSYVGDDNPTSIVVATELANAGTAIQDINSVNLDGVGTDDVLTFAVIADGSGTISDPTFVYTIPGDVTSDIIIGTTEIRDTDGTTIVAVASDVVYDAVTGMTTAKFEGDSSQDALSGHSYYIDDAAGVPEVINADVTTAIAGASISVELYSTSGTEELRTTEDFSPFSLKNQYKFTCSTKFDGMINYENSSLSFVPTGHGIDNTLINVRASDDTTIDTLSGIDGIADVNTDAFIFTIANNVDNDIDLRMDGDGTIINISGDDTSNVATMLAAITGDLVRVDTAVSVGGVNVEDADGDGNNETLAFEFTAAIPNNATTTYVASAVTDYTAGLEATAWTSTVAIDDADAGAGYAMPTIDYTANSSAGEWQDYTYIAQIPATTSTTTATGTETKIFIVNRSCVAAAPTFKLIKDGVVTEVTNVAAVSANTSIAVDTQELYKMQDVIAKAIADGASIDAEGKYAVEVVLPGLAEDFYTYAQAFSNSAGNFKDLPVYSTSTRN